MSEPVGNSPRSGVPGGGGGMIPSNSHKEREARAQQEPAESRDKVEKITSGKVTTRKPPWWKRFARNMVADDVTSIGDYLLIDVIVPAARNLIRDIVVGSTDRALYGSTRSRRESRFSTGGSSIRTRYDKMSEEPRRMSREARARHDFDEVVLDSHSEAVAVIEELIARVDRYGATSVADLYDLVGVTGSYADRNHGWTDLRTADVRQSRGGFLLDLPRPEPLR